MVDAKDKTRKSTSRKSGNSGGSRKSRRSSSRKSGSGSSKSQSPHRSEPRRSKRSKEDLEAKERARAASNSDIVELNTVDHTGTVEAVEAGDGRKHRSSKRRSQQDRGIAKDNVAKAKGLINRSNQPNTGPAPGAHAKSRGDQVAKDKKSKGRFSRPLGTQSVFTMDERARMEAEKAKEREDGLVMATTIDESHDEGLAMTLLNSMLDHQMNENDSKSKGTKNTQDKTKMSSDSSKDSKEEGNEEKDWEKSKLKKGVCIFRYLCCVIVLAAAGVGAWIALRESNNSGTTSDTIEPSLGVPINGTTPGNNTNGLDSTQDPINNTLNPSSTASPNGAPIDSNIRNDFIFDPPSNDDCAAITNGGSIKDQDTMPVQSYLINIDATPFLSMDLSISADIIEVKLEELLAPALTGCNRDTRKLGQYNRLLADDDVFLYAIGNVMVDALGIEGLPCVDDSNPICHRVNVAVDIVVKHATVKIPTVITELSLFFGGGGLANKLELGELYESIIAVNLGTTDITESPSISDKSDLMEPSMAPSAIDASPTLLDSESPTSTSLATPLPTSSLGVQETQNPTSSSPTPRPTPRPTPPPTPDPGHQATPTSPLPTQRPTPFPTPRPTPFPTARPVSSPTFAPDPTPLPSSSPTKMPSTRPTTSPVAPSQSPSNNPSRLPSISPTATPTSSPTSGPTRTPSSQPTPQPSPLPSPAPTSSPTDQPSAAPSTPPPVPLSISSDRCGYLESVLGNKASLHQLAIDWMCNTDTWEPTEEESYPEQWHDRYAIVAFFYAGYNDHPDAFKFHHGYGYDVSTVATCNWYSHGFAEGCSTMPGSKVRKLYFLFDARRAEFGDEGYLPAAIGLLTNLESISFGFHIGRFPTELGLLTALTVLDLLPKSYYETDDFPTEIGALTRLEHLYVQRSHYPEQGLRGTIPSVLMNLTKLTNLNIGDFLTGTIPPSIIGLTDLEYLKLGSNGLTGTDSIGLTGTIPPLPTTLATCFLRGGSFDDSTNGVSANCIV